MLDFNLPTAKYQEQIHQSSIPQTQEEFLIKAEIAGFDTHDLSAFNAYIYIYMYICLGNCTQIHSYGFLY